MTEIGTPRPVEPPIIYQLRVVLRGISPLIWRRLLVPADTSVAGLHDILQAAFSWSGEHLHRFIVHGVEHGISYEGGLWFRRDARRTRIADLGLRVGERFAYEYDLEAAWRHDLRVEAIFAGEPGRPYPCCIGGRRAGPSERWGGPWGFMEASQPHHVYAAVCRAAEITRQILDGEVSAIAEHREEMAHLRAWLELERFDRRALNKTLSGLGTSEGRAA